MQRYAFLVLPAFNRVYGEAAARLGLAELAVLNQTVLGGRLEGIEETRIAGLAYVAFRGPDLSERDLAHLASLSSIYALFALPAEGGGGLLRPLELRPRDRFSSDLVTILKYPGKTNEHFTKLLLNVTLLSRAEPHQVLDQRLTLLDPLCGRGTTLNQGLLQGLDVAGIELDRKDFEAYSHFIQTWLKNKRFKHTAEVTSLSRNREPVGRRLDVRFATSKEAWKSGEVTRVCFVQADTREGREFFRPASFDLVVADAPYGVQHGSQEPGAGLSRRPLQLLREALPVWRQLLRPGGAIGLSFNTHVGSRDQVAALFEESGLQVQRSPAHLGFAHRVDQAIVRDLVVGRSPSSGPGAA